MGQREVALAADRPLVEADCLIGRAERALAEGISALQVQSIHIEFLCASSLTGLCRLVRKACAQRRADLVRQFHLQLRQLRQRALEDRTPQVRCRGRVDQLHRQACRAAGDGEVTRQDRPHAQHSPGLGRRGARVPERHIARDYLADTGDRGQRVDESLRDSLAEILHLAATASQGERQHSERVDCLAGLVGPADADEAVTAPRHGLDVVGACWRIGERRPQLLDCSVEAGFEVDDGARRPQSCAQLATRDDLAGSLEKTTQQLQRLRLQGYELVAAIQVAGSSIEAVRSERNPVRLRQSRAHALPLDDQLN